MNALYTGASGMYAENQWINVVAGNLANGSSAGYLPETGRLVAFPLGTVSRSVAPKVVGQTAQGVALELTINPAQGPIVPTGRSLDWALSGDGFFQVSTPNGIAYTRAGKLTLDAAGRLTTATGAYVLDTNGQPIVLGSGPVTVTAQGVIFQKGQPVAQLALASLPAQGLTALGQDLYTSPRPAPYQGVVEQGALNASGVSLTGQAVDLAEAQARYQSLAAVVNEESNRMNSAAGLGLLA